MLVNVILYNDPKHKQHTISRNNNNNNNKKMALLPHSFVHSPAAALGFCILQYWYRFSINAAMINIHKEKNSFFCSNFSLSVSIWWQLCFMHLWYDPARAGSLGSEEMALWMYCKHSDAFPQQLQQISKHSPLLCFALLCRYWYLSSYSPLTRILF